MNDGAPLVAGRNSRLFRIGGASALALAVFYVVITVLYSLGGALPEGPEAWLTYLAGHSREWWAILYLSVVTDVLFLPVAWALFASLRRRNESAMLVGAGLLVLFALLDLAITWPNYATLIHLSGQYVSATGDARTTVLAAATYAVGVLDSTLFGVYAILVPSLGILVIGQVMLKGVYGRLTAWLGIATGISGIVAVVGPLLVDALGIVAVLTSVLTLVWLFLVGYRLLRLS